MRARSSRAGAADGPGDPATAGPHPRGGARDLAVFYLRVTVLASVAFGLLVGAVTWAGWRTQQAEERTLAAQRVQQAAGRLDTRLEDVGNELRRLHRWSRDLVVLPPEEAGYVRRAVSDSLEASGGRTFTLDSLGRSLDAPLRPAQVVGLASADRPVPGAGRSPLDLAVSLADRLGTGRATAPWLRSTYFVGARGDVYAVAPWTASAALGPGVRETLAQVRAALPPEPRGFGEVDWDEPRADGEGPLVLSASMPVSWSGTQVGTLGTDVTLDFLDDFLGQFPDPEGEVLVVDPAGTVLGQRSVGGPPRTLRTLSDAVPGLDLPAGRLATGGTAETDTHEVFLASLEDPGVTVVLALRKDTVAARAFNDFAGQAMVALALMLALLILQLVLWRMYVAPSLAVAGYVERTARGEQVPAPRVPGRWRPWVTTMTRAFTERARLDAELRAGRDELEERVAQRTAELAEERSAAQTQAALLSVVLEGMHDGVMVVDADGRVRVHNLAARTILGQYIPTDAPIPSWEKAFGLRPLDPGLARVRKGFPAVLLRDPGQRAHESVLIRSDRPEENRSILVDSRRLPGGQLLVLLRDVTGEKARHRELEHFAGTVAHDLRSPLTALTGWLEHAGLLLDSDPERARDSLVRAGRAGQRMRQVIDDWLAYTVTREGVVHPEPVSLDEALVEVLAVHADDAATIEVDTPHRLMVDPTLLRQLLANLVGNAWKYARPGVAPYVEISSHDAGEPGWVELRVADRGVGVQAGDEERIFGQFERSEKDAATQAGTGLGLALCRAIVSRHGGRIWVEANEHGGATFRLTLPEAPSEGDLGMGGRVDGTVGAARTGSVT